MSKPADDMLAIVLHTHMPYVEGFGTWPFGEEWLWEAMAGCYLPLLELLDRGAPLTVSLTPVLCDQLEVEGLAERFERFVEEVRVYTHTEDARGLRAGGFERLALELERSLGDYLWARERLAERGGDMLRAFEEHAHWTSSATHAVLPLLATDAGVRAQVQVGVESHRARFGGWGGGFWLPECAHAPYLERVLAEASVKACCVELTGVAGAGGGEHLKPVVGEAGVVLVPIDRETMSLVWSEGGYPADGRYRDYHRHTVHHHNPWNNAGGAYDHEQAMTLAREHAADFVLRTRQRLTSGATRSEAGASARGSAPALVVCALDTELLGHWWYEGVGWLAAVVEECERQGLALVRLDDALERCVPESVVWDQEMPASSWGQRYDLSTWSGPAVAEIAFAQRKAELRLLQAGRRADAVALRQLMAMQASDWAFMVSRGQAVPYARERFARHAEDFEVALGTGAGAGTDGLRNLARYADPACLAAMLS